MNLLSYGYFMTANCKIFLSIVSTFTYGEMFTEVKNTQRNREGQVLAKLSSLHIQSGTLIR